MSDKYVKGMHEIYSLVAAHRGISVVQYIDEHLNFYILETMLRFYPEMSLDLDQELIDHAKLKYRNRDVDDIIQNAGDSL